MAVKYLVGISLPAALKKFEMWIPADSRIGEINCLVSVLAEELSGGSFRKSSSSVLINAESGEICDVNMTAYELNIRNGSEFILI